MCEGLARIRNDAVGDFEAVDVGLVFRIAAEGVANGIGSETEKGQEQEKRGKRSPIVEGADTPGSARTREKPTDGAVAEVEKNENHNGDEQKLLPDVTQDVVAHFVAKISEYFIGGFLRDSGVPNDDALGSAEAIDGGVCRDGFVAGFHPEHAVGRDFLAGAARDTLELRDELRGFDREGFVFIEERVDHVGRDEHAEQEERQRDDPEIEPPAAGAPADDGVKNPNEQTADDDGEELGFGPISYPGGPGLDGDFVEFGDRLMKDVEGKLENTDDQYEERSENIRLEEAVTRKFFRPIAKFGRKSPAQDKPENQEAVEKANDA